VHRRKKRALIWFFIVLVIGGVVVYAPYFLLYSSAYQKTDAIVLFLGPDFSARQKEAYKLIDEGMAEYLIIPAYRKIYRVYDEGAVKHFSANLFAHTSLKKKNFLPPFPSFYEDTHIETIEAKKMMADLGLRSVIFVSSPYHMRRIKLIAAKVFGADKDNLYFVPTSFEKASAKFWRISGAEWKKVGWEYVKMLWFCLYTLWGR